MECYLAIERKEVLIHATVQMNLGNMLNEISQIQKGKYYMITFI